MLYESVIVNFLLTLFNRAGRVYKESATARILHGIAVWFKSLFSGSSIWNFAVREESISTLWKSSGVLRLMEANINFPSRIFRNFYEGHKQAFSDSYIFKLLDVILVRFEVFPALFLILVFAVPHTRWNNIYGTAGVLALVLLYFVKTIMYSDESFDLKSIDFILFVFMLSVVLATVTSYYPKDSLRILLFFITCFLLLLVLVSSVKSGRSLGLLLELMLVGVSLSGLYGIWQHIVGVPINPAYTDLSLNEGMPGRVYSTMGNPNNYAELLILTMPFFWTVIANSRSMIKKAAYIFMAIPPLIALFYTGSRSGWGAFAAAILVVVFFTNRKLILPLIVVGVLCIPLLPDFIYHRIQTIWDPRDTSAHYRQLILKSIAPMFKDFWFTGVGLGSTPFMKVAQAYEQYTKAAVAHSHNLFLQIWIETGFIGIVTFMWSTVRLVKKCMANIFGGTDKYVNNVLIAAVASITGIFVMGLVEYVWFYPRILLAFWVDISIILAGLKILASKNEVCTSAIDINR